MKKYLIFILLAFLVCVPKVYAEDDECVSNHTCMALCNYTSTFSYSNGGTLKRNVAIYYHFKEKKLSISYQKLVGSNNLFSKGPSDIGTLFSDKGFKVHWGIVSAPSMSNFTCPAHGYIDSDTIFSDDELCFDNDGTTCRDSESGFGTAFGKSKGFQSEKKDYDFEEQIAKYAEWIFGDIAEDISNGEFDVANDLMAKIDKDFEQNFLYGNDMPEFILNSDAYKTVKDNALEEFEKTKESEIEKSEKEVEDGTKTEEEHQEVVDNWNQASENVEQALDDAFNGLETNIAWSADFDVSNECDSYLGNPEVSGTPAYYLQFIFNIMKYAGILLLFALTVVDVVKAIASSNQDALQKTMKVFAKRLIIMVIIFFLPILIDFSLTVLGIYSTGTCGIT